MVSNTPSLPHPFTGTCMGFSWGSSIKLTRTHTMDRNYAVRWRNGLTTEGMFCSHRHQLLPKCSSSWIEFNAVSIRSHCIPMVFKFTLTDTGSCPAVFEFLSH